MPNGQYHVDTILDAELVYESRRGKQELFMLFFDALAIQGLNLCPKSYSKRLGVIVLI